MRRILAVSLLGAALALGACGGGESDEDKIKDIVASVDKKPASLCTDYASDKFLAELGGEEACKKSAKEAGNRGKSKVTDLEVDGKKATATIKDKDSKSEVTFTKDGDDWQISRSEQK